MIIAGCKFLEKELAAFFVCSRFHNFAHTKQHPSCESLR